ncbi:kinase-like domain-containing protein [Trichophaea hybrida]|nr:kinase-like domain-containing protein [Trichophaea hybrida]
MSEYGDSEESQLGSRRNTTWGAQFFPDNGESSKTSDYKEFAMIHLDGETTLAHKDDDVIAIKKFATYDIEIIRKLMQIPHPNVVFCLDIISQSPNEILISQEPMITTLSQVLAAPMKFTEVQIATVCREVLQGLQFLKDNEIIHGKLNSQTVLLNYSPEVKIGGLWSCQRGNSYSDINNVGVLCMEMMEYGILTASQLTNKEPCLQKPGDWSPDLLDFVETTMISPEKSVEHVFLGRARGRGVLLPNVMLSLFSTQRNWCIFP